MTSTQVRTSSSDHAHDHVSHRPFVDGFGTVGIDPTGAARSNRARIGWEARFGELSDTSTVMSTAADEVAR